MASVSELACIYSALILHDDEVTVTVSVIGLSRGMNIRDVDTWHSVWRFCGFCAFYISI